MDLVPIYHPNLEVNVEQESQELAVVQQREQRLAKLRRDQDLHHHRQIWIKDAHGGPYDKVLQPGLDPMSSNLQGTLVLGTRSPPRPGT